MYPELSDKHSGSIRLMEIGVAIAVCEKKKNAKKVGNFHFLCLYKSREFI